MRVAILSDLAWAMISQWTALGFHTRAGFTRYVLSGHGDGRISAGAVCAPRVGCTVLNLALVPAAAKSMGGEPPASIQRKAGCGMRASTCTRGAKAMLSSAVWGFRLHFSGASRRSII